MLETIARILRAIKKILGYAAEERTIVPPDEYQGYKCKILNQKDPLYLASIDKRLRENTSELFRHHDCSHLCAWIEVEYDYQEEGKGWLFVSCWGLKYKTSWRDAPAKYRLYDHALVIYGGGFFHKSGNVHVNRTPIFKIEFSSENLINSDNFAIGATLNTALLLKKKKYTNIAWANALEGNLTYGRKR